MIVDDICDLDMADIFASEGRPRAFGRRGNSDRASNVKNLADLGTICLADAQCRHVVRHVDNLAAHHQRVADALRQGRGRNKRRCGNQGKYKQLFHQMSPARDWEEAA